jgi:cystathionine gamma-synthase
MNMLQITDKATSLASRPGTERRPGASTQAVHGRRDRRRRPQPHHALATPVAQTATYTFDSSADLTAFMAARMWGGDAAMAERVDYGRYGNPTVRAVERRLAELDGGEDALLYPTGMAAITNTLLTMLSAGSHVVFTDDCYRKTRQFCQGFLRRLGIESSQAPMGDYDALEAAIRPNTRLIFSESPTNPYLRVVDLERLAVIGRRRRVKTVIDATFATPVNVQPLEYGIDLVLHSATKYLGGHNDLMAGVVIGEAGLIHGLRQAQGVLGGVVEAHTAFLLERGLKTLALRVRQQNQTAHVLAEYLVGHPRVERVWYPGLADHPDHAVAQAQMAGFGGVISFTIAARDGSPLEIASRFIDSLTIPLIAPSLGGVESLVEQPALMSYFELSSEERLAIGIPDNLVRLAVGIEDSADLLADLAQALGQL